ncbi:MAG TPA: RNA polymerase sigma factor [Flavobacteriales bacterium]|nr:RNA polymerase sigma factor [Flavobacteriales bacterium]HRJ36653.1 RNA polymerase sigma factor [Flavobacteriales bacterium]HRJ37654.1 RNA polymerase sigma factor [Flavobacteriales bacterium]
MYFATPCNLFAWFDVFIPERPMTDEQLIKECLSGRPSAQKTLYERFSRKMMGVCIRYSSSYEEAQDVLQDGFVKVFEKLGTYSGNGSFEGWVRRIMVNTALDSWRKNKQEREMQDIDEVGYGLSSGEDIVSNITAEDLLAILQTIPSGYRMVFNLYVIEGYSHKEIGEMLNITESTSKSQFSRARSYLMNILQKQNML